MAEQMPDRAPEQMLRGRYYAGDQNQFAPLDQKIARYGCGLIGLTDLLLYLMEQDWKQPPLRRFPAQGQENKVRTTDRDQADAGRPDSGQAAKPGQTDAGRPDRAAADRGMVVRHGGKAYESFVKSLDRRLAHVRSRVGLNGISMARAFNRRARQRGWSLRAAWGVPGEQILPRIREMLAADLPVILSIGPFFGKRGDPPGILLYPEKEPVPGLPGVPGEPAVRAADHYVTVVGLTTQGGEEWFRIVSWGICYLARVRDYMEGQRGRLPLLGRLFSNILYLREK